MSKYEPLTQFLKDASVSVIEMSFEDVSRIIDAELPASAYRHRAWWSNNSAGHVVAQAWLSAGYESESVDLAGHKVTFRRLKEDAPAEDRNPLSASEKWDRLYGCLKGTAQIPAGLDITEPAGAEWEGMKD